MSTAQHRRLVVHVVLTACEELGGVPQTAIQLARALARRGRPVEIWATDVAGPLPEGVGHAASAVAIRTFALEPFRALKISGALIRQLESRRSEIRGLHVHGLWFPASSLLMRRARQLGVPYVVKPAGMAMDVAAAKSEWKKRLYWRWIEVANLRAARALFYSTPVELERQLPGFRVRGPECLTLPDAVAPELLERVVAGPPRRGDATLRIGSMGRIDPLKRFDRLLEAARLVATAGRRLEVEIAGDASGRLAERLCAQAAATAPQVAFKLLGHLGLEAKIAFLRTLDVYVCSSDVESFGVALLEAAAIGLPVVLTDRVGLADAFRRHGAGWIVEPEAAAIAAAIETLVADTDETPRMQARAQALARSYSWDVIAKDLDGHYDRLFGMGDSA